MACWRKMLEDKAVTEEMVRDWREEPGFEMEIETFEGVEGLGDIKNLLKTPQQLRREAGLDTGLTSQR